MWLFRLFARWRTAEFVDTGASLYERAGKIWPWVSYGVPTLLGVAGYIVQSLPFAIGLAIVVYVALGVQRDRMKSALIPAPPSSSAALSSPQNLPSVPRNALLDMQPGTDVARLERDVASTQLNIAMLKKKILEPEEKSQEIIVKYIDDLNKNIEDVINQQKNIKIKVEQLGVDVFTLFRARDAERMMKELDSSIALGSNLLSQADQERYPTEDAWLNDYRIWSKDVEQFWTLIRGWSSSVEDPFAPPDAHYRYPDIIPNNPIFGTHKMRNDYHMLAIVSHRHLGFRRSALEYISQKATPP